MRYGVTKHDVTGYNCSSVTSLVNMYTGVEHIYKAYVNLPHKIYSPASLDNDNTLPLLALS